MPKRELVMKAVDDGTTVHVTVEEYVTLGSSRVGPTMVYEGDQLSLPFEQVSDWRRDMAVVIAERL